MASEDRIASSREHIRTSRTLQGRSRETIEATLVLVSGNRRLGITCGLCGDALRKRDDLTTRDDKLVHTHCGARMESISGANVG